MSLSRRCTSPGRLTSPISCKLRAVVQQGVQQRPGPVPGPGMDHQPRRLVDHQQVPVLKDNLQGQGFGGEMAGLGRGHLDGDRLAGPHLMGGGLRGAVDRHQPGLEEFLQAGPGPAQGLSQKLVQTGPGLGRRHQPASRFHGLRGLVGKS